MPDATVQATVRMMYQTGSVYSPSPRPLPSSRAPRSKTKGLLEQVREESENVVKAFPSVPQMNWGPISSPIQPMGNLSEQSIDEARAIQESYDAQNHASSSSVCDLSAEERATVMSKGINTNKEQKEEEKENTLSYTYLDEQAEAKQASLQVSGDPSYSVTSTPSGDSEEWSSAPDEGEDSIW